MHLPRRHVLTLLAAAGLGTLAVATARPVADHPVFPGRLEVAMDGTSFSFEGATNANGAPAAGTPFIVQGYLYPAGTFARSGQLSGVNPDGSPQFPDEVLGTWICRGWHLQDGDALTGPVVATTQIFDFDPQNPGAQTIIADGIELADFDVRFQRAITGGTGAFEGMTGQFFQAYVGHGLNASGGFNTVFGFGM